MEYAKVHGITLLQIVDRKIMTIQNSTSQSSDSSMNRVYPKYIFAIYDLRLHCPIDFTYYGKKNL